MGEWHTMKTAPKSGPKIDVYSARWNIRWLNCFWSPDDEAFISRTMFVGNTGRRVTQFRLVEDPTHWMLAPSPPAERDMEAVR